MFRASFDTNNAAFDGDAFENEIARILRQVALDCEHGNLTGSIFDAYGNRVGEYSTEGFDE